MENYISGAKDNKLPDLGVVLKEIEGADRFKKKVIQGGQALNAEKIKTKIIWEEQQIYLVSWLIMPLSYLIL